MNTHFKLSNLVILSVLLSSCNGGGLVPKKRDITQNAEYVYNIQKGEKNWFGGKWHKRKEVDVTIPEKGTLVEISPGTILTCVVIDGEDGVADKVTVHQQDTAGNALRFVQKVENLLLRNNESSLTIKGTKDSIFQIGHLRAEKGNITTSAAQIILDFGSIDKGTTISSTAPGQDNIVFASFPNQGISKKEFKIDGTFDANLLLPQDFTLWGSGKITGKLTNKGTLLFHETGTLKVGSFKNEGLIKVILGLHDKTVPLLRSSGAIELGGKLVVFRGVKGETHVILKGESITGDLQAPPNVTAILSPDKTTYSVTIDKVVPEDTKTKSLSVSHLFSKYATLGSFVADSHIKSSQTGIDFMHGGHKKDIGGVSFVANTHHEQIFLALSAGGLGAYIECENSENIDVGAYYIHTFEGFHLTHFAHMGKSAFVFSKESAIFESKNQFFEVKSEFGRIFNAGVIQFFPKVMAGLSKLLDVDATAVDEGETFCLEASSHGTFWGGVGFDVTSKFTFGEFPVETFMSLDIFSKKDHGLSLVGDDQRFNDETTPSPSFSFGFKAYTHEKSTAYGSIKIKSSDDLELDLGVNLNL